MKDLSESLWRRRVTGEPETDDEREIWAEVSALCPPCNQSCRQGRDCPSDEPPLHWADGFIALVGVGFLALIIFGVL